MAAISITAASVLQGADARVEQGIFGATITQGQVCYLDATTGKMKLADADGAAALKVARCIALSAGADGQPGTFLMSGDITIGGTLTAGLPYFLSPDTPGGIALIADVAVGDDYVQIGIAESATVLHVDIQNSGFTRAA